MIEKEIRHAHFFCGLGGAARGFNNGSSRVGNTQAKFRCIGGIDSDIASIADFNKLAGCKGTVLDLFDRPQFEAFHGHEPPEGWSEATTADIHEAFGHERPHIVFLSAPCKGFSGLLPEKSSRMDKYQALNALTLRGVWLMMEAYKDDPPELVVFENVPRIASRGRSLLDQINAILASYGYSVAETTHDCGELGGLAQTRKRFLLVARHREKVPPFLYEPPKRSLRGVGEVLEKMPVPDGEGIAGGPMHRVPSLQWRTWLRLAFVTAGKDWRSLNELNVEDGFLSDFAIEPAGGWRDNAYGVNGWEDAAPTITSQRSPGQGRFSVADPREINAFGGCYGVRSWEQSSVCVQGRNNATNGSFSVADPRPADVNQTYQQYGVGDWGMPVGALSGQSQPGGGKFSVADPRFTGPAKFNNCFRIVPFDQPSAAVTGGGGPSAGGLAVADPRPAESRGNRGKYRVTSIDEPTPTVIAASTTGEGAFAVADPRPEGFKDGKKDYVSGGHYGVLAWDQRSRAVAGAASYDNSFCSIADPRHGELSAITELPKPTDQLVAVIQSLDGTWHRPFTTLELAALQSLFCPEETLELEFEGKSHTAWRERIGNAVPSDAAEAIASTMGETLLLAWAGETFQLSSYPIWVQPFRVALSVDTPEGLSA